MHNIKTFNGELNLTFFKILNACDNCSVFLYSLPNWLISNKEFNGKIHKRFFFIKCHRDTERLEDSQKGLWSVCPQICIGSFMDQTTCEFLFFPPNSLSERVTKQHVFQKSAVEHVHVFYLTISENVLVQRELLPPHRHATVERIYMSSEGQSRHDIWKRSHVEAKQVSNAFVSGCGRLALADIAPRISF